MSTVRGRSRAEMPYGWGDLTLQCEPRIATNDQLIVTTTRNALSAQKCAAMIPVSHAMMLDGPQNILEIIADDLAASMDIQARPWAYWDRPVAWTFDLFPRWTRLQRRWRSLKARIAGRFRRDDDEWGYA